MTDDEKRTDGGFGHGEVRERIATVEAHLEKNREEVTSIDDKQDQILNTVQRLDKNLLTESEFKEQYEGDIQANTRLRYFLKWGGGIAVGILASTSVLEWVTLL